MRRRRQLDGEGEDGAQRHRGQFLGSGLRRMLQGSAIVLLLLATLTGGSVLVRQHAVSAMTSHGRRAEPAKRDPRPFRMLFVGASITAGMGAENASRSYPYLVADWVRRREGPVDLTVIAHTGARAPRVTGWRYPGGQNVIVVHLATNDYIHATPIPTYKSDLDAVLRRLRKGSPHATLICLGAWVRPSSVDHGHLAPSAYDAVDRGDCRSFHGHYVALDNLYMNPSYHDPAPLQVGPALPHAGTVPVAGRRVAFHPSDAGHAAIARAVFEELRRTHALPPRKT